MSLKGLLIPLCIVLCVALVVAALFVAGAFDRNSVPSQDDPVLVGAGDIADGVSDNDEATAALIRCIPGTVFTVGDNAYGSPSEASFEIYYDPTWGTEKDRTKPTPGNHEYKYGRTAGGDGAKDYFDYFGSGGRGQRRILLLRARRLARYRPEYRPVLRSSETRR